MSIGRPRATYTTDPTMVEFTNLITVEDMKLALSLMKRSVRKAIFLSHSPSSLVKLEVVGRAGNTPIVDDKKNIPANLDEKYALAPRAITPKAIEYFFKHNKHVRFVTFQDIDSNHVPALAKCLAADQQIVSLCFNPIGLTSNDIAALNAALKPNVTLHTLNINDGLDWDTKAMPALEHANLRALSMANNELKGDQAATLLNAHPHLTLFDISENNLCEVDDNDEGDDDQADAAAETDVLHDAGNAAHNEEPLPPLNALITAIKAHRALHTIVLKACSLYTTEHLEVAQHIEAKQELFTALLTHPTLTTIDITSNDLSIQTLNLIASHLLQNKALSTLNMSSCITPPKMTMDKKDKNYEDVYRRTFKPIRKLFTSHLAHLDLSQNHLENRELQFCSLTLANNRTLTHLSLKRNKITSEGIQYLVAFLEKTKTLQVLDLSLNIIEFQGFYTILEALQNNPNCVVHTLKLQGCQIHTMEALTEEGINDIVRKFPRSLLFLDLTFNSIAKDLNLMQRIHQKLQAHQRLLRFTQQVSPLIAFVRAHVATPKLYGSMLPVIPEITGYLTGDRLGKIDIQEYRKEQERDVVAAPGVKKSTLSS